MATKKTAKRSGKAASAKSKATRRKPTARKPAKSKAKKPKAAAKSPNRTLKLYTAPERGTYVNPAVPQNIIALLAEYERVDALIGTGGEDDEDEEWNAAFNARHNLFMALGAFEHDELPLGVMFRVDAVASLTGALAEAKSSDTEEWASLCDICTDVELDTVREITEWAYSEPELEVVAEVDVEPATPSLALVE
jgi:hypothetical protein